MVIALAGRRVDATNAEQVRFSSSNVQLVSQRIEQMLTSLGCQHLFCSGACGADLLALSVANKLKINRKMVLPFDYQQFRSVSVVDRPGNWGSIFDKVYKELDQKHSVIRLNLDPDDENTYAKTNEAILMKATRFAHRLKGKSVSALIVWDGQSYGQEDTTGLFRQQAIQQGLMVYQVMTV